LCFPLLFIIYLGLAPTNSNPKARRIDIKFIFGSSLIDNGVYKAIYEDSYHRVLQRAHLLPLQIRILSGRVEYTKPALNIS